MLQWSHGRLTVVTQRDGVADLELALASMEPRSFNRGDRADASGHRWDTRLQWSHGRLTVVTNRIHERSD